MTSSPALAAVLGFNYDSPTTEFPVRSGPGTTFDALAFKAQKGWKDMPILDVQPDAQNTPNDNDKTQVYQWFKVTFPNGQAGWMRGHVLGIYGDCSSFGYGALATPTYAYLLTRTASAAAPATSAPAASTTTSTAASQQDAAANAFVAAAQAKSAQSSAPAAPAAQPAPKPTGAPTAIVMGQSASRLRRGPSTTFDLAGTIPRGTAVPILAVQQENAGQKYRWFKVSFQGQEVWIREDNVTYTGDTSALGLPTDLYPAPMGANRYWVRGFNVPPNIDATIVEHDGWDLGAQVGEAMFCGPKGGLVVQSFQCKKCTPDHPSAVPPGGSAGDPSVLSDPDWGFGYGNYIIIRYLNEQLPDSTKALLAQRGFPGGHLFVMHAHMDQRLIQAAGVTLPGGAQIGTCGNTGNSEGPHLHLEVRAAKDPTFTRWAVLKPGLMDPVVLYTR